MNLPKDSAAAFYLLVGVNRAAFASGQYVVAFHAAMAAAHVAEDARDTDRLRRLEALLAEQRDRIDKDGPTHPLAGPLAQIRGNTGEFHSAHAQVHSMIQRLEVDAQKRG
jgi:hypothetical protein